MKVLEHVINIIIREQVSIQEIQFGFMLNRGTTDTIVILRQLHEKDMQKKEST